MSRRILLLCACALASIILYMTVEVRGNIWFALALRSVKLLAMIQVAIAISVSTVIFQTITGNRILTPSIMRMDALYIFIQSLLVFIVGGAGYVLIGPELKFFSETAAMVALVCALFIPLLRFSKLIPLLLLTGIVLGVLFRSLASLIGRLIDPNDFTIVQTTTVANFNQVDATLLLPTIILTASVLFIVWRQRFKLDVMMLGPDTAISFGINWQKMSAALLIAVGVLVSASTALIGPVTFLGLLVVAVTDRIIKTRRHGVMFVASSLVAIAGLVLGQAMLEHLFDNVVVLGVLIELAGGIAFLALLLSRRTK